MPYSRKAKFLHHRQHDPRSFAKQTFKTVSIFHTNYHGVLRKLGNKAVVGYNRFTGQWGIQSILEKKHKH